MLRVEAWEAWTINRVNCSVTVAGNASAEGSSAADDVLTQLSRQFDAMYASGGRPSIPPEKLLRAQLLQMLYSIRNERLLMEEIDYSMLFRRFVGLNLDEEVWDATTFTKNLDRLLGRGGQRVLGTGGGASPGERLDLG